MSNDIFSDQVAIVTGASSGIGAVTALCMAKKGAVVIINGRNETRLNQVENIIKDNGGKSLSIVGDLTSQSFTSYLINQTIKEYSRIDVLINCAGGGSTRETIEDQTDDDWEGMIAKNMTTIFKVCREVTPQMKKQHYGRIVNVSSVAGRTSSFLAGYGYTAAKAGLQGFTRHLASELGAFGINVNAIAPGITKTERIIKKWQRRSQSEQEKISNTIALRRLAEPCEIANAIAFLASRDASYITGATLDVNGGIFMS